MKKVKIFTDSTVDLSDELLSKFDIEVIPLYVTIGGKSYKDMVDIRPDELYTLVEKLGELPKSSAPSVSDYFEAFSRYVKADYDIVYVALSSKLSASYQNACIAAKEFEEGRVVVVDSLNLSTGIGQLAIYAAELASQGMDAKEVYRNVMQRVPKVRSSFIISTLKYLHMGGRCSSLQMIAGNLLRINPQIVVKEGSLVVGNKYRGRGEKVWDEYYKDAVGDAKMVDKRRVFVTHSAYIEAAEYLKKKLEDELKTQEVIITHAGCVISTHCGPGTVGILYTQI